MTQKSPEQVIYNLVGAHIGSPPKELRNALLTAFPTAQTIIVRATSADVTLEDGRSFTANYGPGEVTRIELPAEPSILRTIGAVILSALAVLFHDPLRSLARLLFRPRLSVFAAATCVPAGVYWAEGRLSLLASAGIVVVTAIIAVVGQAYADGGEGASAASIGGEGNVVRAGNGRNGGAAICIGGEGNVVRGGDCE